MICRIFYLIWGWGMIADKWYMYMNENYENKTGNTKQKNKITAMILCTLGFLGIGTMFDLICIVFDKFSDSENRKLTVE